MIITESSFISILSDGSQARKTGKEKELILIRVERNGHPEYMVVSLLDMSRFGGSTANAIMAGINSLFQDEKSVFYMNPQQFKWKLISATADGANVNFGQYIGVLSQLSFDRPWLLKIHCINHRIELTVKTALSNRALEEVDEFYRANFYLLRNSGKIKQMTIEGATTIGITYYNLPKIHGTRFIGHRRRGFTSLLEVWPAFVMAYESFCADKNNKSATRAKVKGLLKKFHSYDVLVIVETYLDLLEIIVPTSKVFETNELLPHEIPPTIKTTLMTLEMKMGEIGEEQEFIDSFVCRYRVTNTNDEISGEFIRAGDKRKRADNQEILEVKVPMKKIKADTAVTKVPF